MGSKKNYTLAKGRTARFSRRTGPTGLEWPRAYSKRGVMPGYCAYRPKGARTGTYTHAQGHTARFSRRTVPKGLERARACAKPGVQPGFQGVQAQTG